MGVTATPPPIHWREEQHWPYFVRGGLHMPVCGHVTDRLAMLLLLALLWFLLMLLPLA